jgi:hypothetical protein
MPLKMCYVNLIILAVGAIVRGFELRFPDETKQNRKPGVKKIEYV